MTHRSFRLLAAVALALLMAAAGLIPLTLTSASAVEGGPSPRPPMGWNSWNTFGCDIDEAKIRSAADAMVTSGMKAAGYSYVVVDDCWFNPDRDAHGDLQGSPTRFPSGMKALGDYIHSKGLKFGLYEVPTDRTCAQRNSTYPGSTGSLGHEAQDARQFAAWGVDYVKYDWCSWDGTLDYQIQQFTLMRDAIKATGRPMVYSINPNSYHADDTGATYNWGRIADLWRTTEDVVGMWDSGHGAEYPVGVVNASDVNSHLADQQGPGRWNDPDMLVVGRPGLSTEESRSQFGLWAVMGAPLMAGNDIRSMPPEISSILRNTRLIAVDQDALGAGGRKVRDDGATEVFAKPLANGSVAIGLLNRGAATTTISTSVAEIGLTGANFTTTDLWTGKTSTTVGPISASVPSHGIAVFTVSGGTPATSRTTSLQGVGSGRCLGVVGASTVAGAGTEIQDCRTTANQLFTTWPNGELRVFGDKCLDAYDQGTAPGTRVITWQCNGQSNQQWVLKADGTVRGVQSGLCLDVDGGGTSAGTRLILWTCHAGSNQRWARA